MWENSYNEFLVYAFDINQAYAIDGFEKRF